MSLPPPPSLPSRLPETPLGPWARFRRRHLHDYNRPAMRVWLAVVAAGGCAFAFALWQLAQDEPARLLQWLWVCAFVAAAACMPVRIPRTRYSFGVGDIFIFTLLVTQGPAAAAVAAAIEGGVGAWRSSQRLTSRLGTPAAAAAAMMLCGSASLVLRDGLAGAPGFGPGTATVAALALIAVPYFAATTLPLTWMVALKRNAPFSLPDWWQSFAWMAAAYLGSAMIAGLLAFNARQAGPALIFIAAVAAGVIVWLINGALERQEAERSAQERQLEAARRESEFNQQRFTAAFSHAAIGMAIVGGDGVMLRVNQALCQLLGHPEAALVGRPFALLLHPADADLFDRSAARLATSDEGFSIELRCLDAEGAERWVAMHCGHFADPAGQGRATIYQLHDITSRRAAEGQLHHIAYHDDLTDLANRNCFRQRLEVAIEHSRVDAEKRFAVMFIDLDRFKVVNDSLGHHAGNEMLKVVARRLVDSVRPGDLVARLGGDEFAVLLEDLHDPELAVALSNRLLDATARPLQINGTEIIPGASIGITFSDLGYRTTDEILRDADLAMYEAKAGGRHRAVLFDAVMLERVTDRLQLEGDLRRAIGEGQLSVVYQPLYDLEPQRLRGFEALARWTHPVRGPISPAVFIAMAEDCGQIEAVTAWVLEQSLAQLARWQGSGEAGRSLTMNINLSGRDLADPSLAGRIAEALQRHSLAPESLTLEITETTLMERLDVALQTLQKLRELGVRFGIDDFGTGYSSLSYLSSLPIDSLKIDRSFVMGIERQPQNREIVRAVYDLGRSLNKKIVAEGIETPEQLAILRQIGVHVGQGYLLGRPMRPDQVSADLLMLSAPA